MAEEIRCSNCGTLNPAQASACKVCGAKLTRSQEDIPDWLRDLRGGAAEEAASGLESGWGVPSAADEDEIPDWLKEIKQEGQKPAEESAESIDLPDWFSDLSASEPTLPTEPVAPAEADHQDWLSNLGGAAPVAADISAEQEDTSWLSGLQAQSGWMDNLGAAQEPSAAPAEEAASGLPDWLGSLGAAEEPSAAPAEEALPWMQDFQQPAELGQDWLANAPTQEVVPATEVPLDAMPDWMRDLSGAPPSASEPPVEEPATAPASPFALDIPDWLLDGEQRPVALPEEATAVPTGGATSVFTEFPFEETPPPFAAEPAESGAEGLEPAQMPGWVQAMRPVEAVAPTQSAKDAEGRIEQAGPLAGLQGVLPGEDLSALYYRPPVYSSRLRLTERQRLNATLLENLIAEDARSKPVRAETSAAPRRALRLVVAVLLILALLGVLGSGLPALALPANTTPETQAFFNVLTGLLTPEQTSLPILVAFDYQPALSGEMRLISQSVLEDLMAKNVRIIAFSTQPSGPAMAQQLLQDAQQMRPSYVLEYQSLNLGYLVGGASGLQQLSLSPQAALPMTVDGKPAWNQAPLQGVQQLTDFRAVIVLTDDADAARAWVEQVGPRLGNCPLLMVVSAQAEPLVLPYVQSGQVQGMLAGLSGAVQYEVLTQRTLGNARMVWNAYQAGLLFLLVMILIGSIYQAMRGLLTTSKRKRA
jgi:hypothetical protein